MNLFYLDNLKDNIIRFQQEESKHLTKVMRSKPGDIILITDGKGTEAKAEILELDSKSCVLKIVERISHKAPSKHIHIAVSPLKNANRFEWFLEKAVEIGVSEITPIICKRTEKTGVRYDRMEKIMIAAMKQSGRYYLPKLNKATDLKDFLDNATEDQKLIPHCIETDKKELSEVLEKDRSKVILIGPEGDFDEHEVEQALNEGFVPVSLGESRLRTETAAIVALTVLNLP